MIETVQLTKKFIDAKNREFEAVNSISLKINKGEIFGLLGPNGAGKTTFLRMLATIMLPTSGYAVINGFDILTQQKEVKKSIGFLSGNTKLYGKLTPKELLKYFGELYEMENEKIETRSREIFELLDMVEFADKSIEKLSTGQTQRTSIARCLLHDPQVYIFDEPTVGLDILTCSTIMEFMKKEADREKTILFSTHYIEEAETLCDKIGLLHQGKVLDIGTIKELKARWRKNNLRDIFLENIGSYEGEDVN